MRDFTVENARARGREYRGWAIQIYLPEDAKMPLYMIGIADMNFLLNSGRFCNAED